MQKVTDANHLLDLIKNGINESLAGKVEQHLVDNADVKSENVFEYYKVVEPALKVLVAGLPNGSAWKASLGKFVDLMDNEAEIDKDSDEVDEKATTRNKARTPTKK